MQEIESTVSIQKFTKEYILRLPKSPFNNQNISLVANIILRYFWSPIYFVLKVSGPFVETPRIFLCMQNINYAEILA